MFYDPTFILLIPALLLGVWAQFKVRSAYNRYLKVYSSSGLTGKEVARNILNANGLYDVDVEEAEGFLSDHYDPTVKKVRLSSEVYHGTSLASLAIAAHETGHAVQHATNYEPLTIRHAIYPVANIGSSLLFPLMLGAFIFQLPFLLKLGIILYTGAVIFQIVTLPVEFNASSRALQFLTNSGYLTTEEVYGAKKVLNAAAFTYVAATLVAIVELIRLLLISQGMSRDE